MGYNLLVFVLLLMNVWSYKGTSVVIFCECCFRFCIYIVHWSGYCGTYIWCGIHIRGNGCQKFGLVIRGNETLKQYFFGLKILYPLEELHFVILVFCYLSKNFSLLCGFTSVVRNFIWIFPWEFFFSGKIVVKRCLDVYAFKFFSPS